MYKVVFKKSAAKEFLLIPTQYHQAIDESLVVLSSGRFDTLDIKILQPK